MMKKLLYSIGLILAAGAAQAQTANVQAIHNCPDPAAANVAVWLNNTEIIPNFAYKTAIPFTALPAGVPFDITITAVGAPDTTNEVFRKSFSPLMSGVDYALVAAGELAGGSNPFDLFAFAAQQQATNQGVGEVSVKVFHGAYDAPMVDIHEEQIPANEIVPDLSFGEDAGYLDLPATDFDIQVRLQNGVVVGEFDADLTGLDDAAAIVLATGYADPASAVGTEPFGLIAVLPSGAVVTLPSKAVTPARLQVIHNCPDPGAASVDVWLNDGALTMGMPLLDNFAFQDATPYIDAPAGQFFDVTIAGPSSTDTTNPVFRKTFLLESGETYVVVAAGGLAETGATAFDLFAFAGQEQATNLGSSEVSVKAFHGVYDAPAVDVWEVQVGAGEIIPNLPFGSAAGFLDLPATDFDLQVRLQDGQVVGQFDANTTGLADGAGIIVATGYADPASAVGTEPFGLLLVLPDGTVLPLTQQTVNPARLQVIHNCAATDAAVVDVWLNDTKLVPNFAFRTAAGFIDAPAGAYFDVTITAPNSTDTTADLFRQTFILESDSTYIVVAGGTIGSGTYTPASPFQLDVITSAREASTTSGNVDVLVYHGATDAPTVNVNELTVPVTGLVSNISYGEAQGYLDLGALDYILEIEAGGAPVAQFVAPLQTAGLANSAITLLASGFLDPSVNNNGAGFGLWVALPAGGALIELQNVTSVEEVNTIEANIFPVPASNELNIMLNEAGDYSYEVMDITGKVIAKNSVAGSNRIELNVSELPNGQYVIRLIQNDQTSSHRFQIVR